MQSRISFEWVGVPSIEVANVGPVRGGLCGASHVDVVARHHWVPGCISDQPCNKINAPMYILEQLYQIKNGGLR